MSYRCSTITIALSYGCRGACPATIRCHLHTQLTEDLLHVVPDTYRNLTSQLPAFYEGPWVFKRGGLYYLMYPTLHSMDEGERLEYATAHAPQGPWTPRGVLLGGVDLCVDFVCGILCVDLYVGLGAACVLMSVTIPPPFQACS